MDYKYIEQLMERYFQCETTLQEEQILRAFFAQNEQELPQQLRRYQPLFAAIQPTDELGDGFDQRLLALTTETEEQPVIVKARIVSLNQRLRPLFRAAAIVAIVLTLGNAMNITLQQGNENATGDDINYAAYKDTYDDPTAAYNKMKDVLQLISAGYSQVQRADSLQRTDSLYSELK